MSVLTKFCTVSGLTAVSRVFGVIRESVLSHFLGACFEMDAFLIAFKFPGFFRRCFAEGGFHSTFVPYFSDFTLSGKKTGALAFSSRIFTLLFWAMLVFSAVVIIFAEVFVSIMAPGFVSDPEKFRLATEFTRITFPSVAFVALSTVYSAIFVTNRKFFPFAFSPILVNIILICSLFIGKDKWSAGYRISYGVLFSGIFQFVFLYIYAKFSEVTVPRFSNTKITRKIKEFLKKLIPIVVGAGVAQINIFVDTFFGSFLPTGSISYIYFADRFIQFPLALFGISMATILLPEISQCFARGKKEEIREIQSKSVVFTLRLTIPSVVGLISMSYILVDLLYGHGKFSQNSVESTSNVLKIFSLGLPAYVISKIFASVLFAQKDSRTPVIAAIIAVIVNIVLNFVMIWKFGVNGIAIGTAVSGFVNAYVMYRKFGMWLKLEKSVVKHILKIIFASGFMLCFVEGVKYFLPATNGKTSIELFVLFSSCVVGGIFYILGLILLKDDVVFPLFKKIHKRFKGIV